MAVVFASCSDSPMVPDPPVNQPPPGGGTNRAPVIESIAVQGTRGNEPPNFADLSETVDVTATVKDEETALDKLQYVWTAPAGSFTGEGAHVTWVAPATAETPTTVTVTLEVVERYGVNLENRVSQTATVALHDSTKEVGDMARQFLLDFSDSQLPVDYVMRNFSMAECPDPREVTNERQDVDFNRHNFRIVDSRIGPAKVDVTFGGQCPFPDPNRVRNGDACTIVPAYWDSIYLGDNTRGAVNGDDYLSAAYSRAGQRWWLCSSDYAGSQVNRLLMLRFIR
jgi:hypothetical protein